MIPTDQNIVDGVGGMFPQPSGVQDELLLPVLWIFEFDTNIYLYWKKSKYPIFVLENILMHPLILIIL